MLGNLISGFIVILIGVNLIPSVADSIHTAKFGDNASTLTNVTGTSATLIDLVVIFFAIGVMSSGVALAVGGLKNAGML